MFENTLMPLRAVSIVTFQQNTVNLFFSCLTVAGEPTEIAKVTQTSSRERA
jgi:hypothetical protein